ENFVVVSSHFMIIMMFNCWHEPLKISEIVQASRVVAHHRAACSFTRWLGVERSGQAHTLRHGQCFVAAQVLRQTMNGSVCRCKIGGWSVQEPVGMVAPPAGDNT